MATDIKLKRAYDTPSPSDGYRIYIDRLWPQGLSHANFPYDLWDKEISPSTELRERFHADPEGRWESFKEKYAEELQQNPDFQKLKAIVQSKPRVTLLFSSKDREYNNAVILREELLKDNVK